METKVLNPFKALVFSTETSLVEMAQYVRVKANELAKEAITNAMEITGPVFWVYHGADGKPDSRFMLDICLPVYCPDYYSGQFQVKLLNDFKCITSTHNGHWQEMGIVYNHLFSMVFKNGLKPTGVCREMYINMDFDNPENNVTEIQVGVE